MTGFMEGAPSVSSAFSLDFFPRSDFLPGLLPLLALHTWSLWLGSRSSCWGPNKLLVLEMT